jgi:hypothetical protein
LGALVIVADEADIVAENPSTDDVLDNSSKRSVDSAII